MKLIAAFLFLFLSGCTYPFIPLVPRPLEHIPNLQISSTSNLKQLGNELVLQLNLKEVPKEDYISAFLYKDGLKIAEDSKLINFDDRETEFRFLFSDIGQYRLVLFWQNSIVRQFELDLK